MKKLLFLACLALPCVAQAQTVAFTTEDYAPFNYREGKEIKGATVEQVEKVMAAIGVDYTIEVLPWARAFGLARTAPMTCVFATAHNGQRDPLFKWVEPLLVDRNILITRKGSGVTAGTLEEAKKYTIGTQREDYTETILKEKGFTKLDVASDFNATLRKLLSGRIDMMPISELYFEKLKGDQPLEMVTVLSSQPMGIACEKSFPEDLRAKMQAALDVLIANGEQKKIFLKYGMDLSE
ncbi:substrate-binding periplasmic protein [Rhizobium lentis]|uniref:Transporter substrate-binding domain-containing protein n=1 Tax=Rhizobium lentis TaxID=1138194 RepID=A0A9Q3M605_9HYPH|nr:transporter substrate-binding domain-containing protein [Rhizobium lentis]MBX4955478.1 transporter substrate-binding domain-containing protein [Rhizobium lentis]MBX4973479.1 transporter substrate-binding domain-containing protein [Rhizobium lentis]MBX4984785.1 transporter substrate-binding domain-containing protein [Rhizobium lentis]MBX4999929.1 transporter substrate-binding domain-containing protein [Rhizobium lentis]MBX5003230.1 transporter substrate-binding domain-containing protein [Rhi